LKDRLTDAGSIGSEWLVIKTKGGCEIVKIGVLNHQIPLCIVHSVVEICDGYLHPPIIFVVKLNMPVHSNWTHVRCALNQWSITVLPRSIHCRLKIR
jgi:hypothetical protein